MTYLGGMNYAKYRLEEATLLKVFGKHKKAPPPTLCMRDEIGGDNKPSVRYGATSIAFSRRSPTDWDVEEAAASRTAMLDAEAEANCALARLADTRAQCSEQHKAIAAEIDAVQCFVKESCRASSQQQTVQSAKVDAMCYRLQKMKDLLLQRKLRIKWQMTELNIQMNTLSAIGRDLRGCYCSVLEDYPARARVTATNSLYLTADAGVLGG